MYKIDIIPKQLLFKKAARTSRGSYLVRNIHIIRMRSDDGRFGYGECAPLPDLSCDAIQNYAEVLAASCHDVEQTGFLDTERLRHYPSILFGLETALQHLEAGTLAFWDTPFSQGVQGIPINGLIWMGSYDEMYQQISAKIAQGFNCLKLKIGAIDFTDELALLAFIRTHFASEDLTIRVDANGAFSYQDATEKLKQLSQYSIHSIEQPIKAGQWAEMAELVAKAILPIALDEELIGCNDVSSKRLLLKTIQPDYIVLKPSLHGGFAGITEWIELVAENCHPASNQKAWWITSALESNIGLNSIAQWVARFSDLMPQGLGTGQLFCNNIAMPLRVEKGYLWFDPANQTANGLSYV